MKQIVVGVFDRYAAAQQAARVLEDQGFDHDHVHVTGTDQETGSSSTSTTTTTSQASGDRDEGVLGSIRNFFSDLFGPDDSQEVGTYAEAVRRGGAVVKVEVDEDSEAERARQALQQAGAVDIDERVEEWRASGWSPDTSFAGDRVERTGMDTSGTERQTMTSGLTTRDLSDTRTDTRSDTGTQSLRDTGAGEEGVIPIVKEDLAIGKRTMQTGGVRVYSRVVERPVEESVQLRTERAEVHREKVDRPATEADLANLQDRTIEVREMTEKPVVQKEARVVEEVSVGKHVENRTETVRDTVRSTEVEVQNLEGSSRMDTDTRSGMVAGDSSMTDRTTTTRRTSFEDYDSDFRSDFNTNYASSGAKYDDYEPAYRYGHSLRSDQRYSGRQWDDIESDVRTDWERRNPGSAWERAKASVRHAWERVKD